MINKLMQKTKQHFTEVLKIKTSPHSLALGFAIGTFISVLPTPGFNILLALLVILVYPKVSKLAIFGAFLIWNPLTAVPIYAASYKVGNLLFGNAPVLKYELMIANQAYDFSRRILVGGFIVAMFTSMMSYSVVRVSAHIYQKRKKTTE